MVEFGTIEEDDLGYFQIIDTPEEAVEIIDRFVLQKSELIKDWKAGNPKFESFLKRLRKKYNQSPQG
jgi:predicted Rossmann-fold nucleotide-binding protein